MIVRKMMIKAVVLAGGVGGAKMAHGLAQALPGRSLFVLVNVGDDFEHYGLKICPDLDTVCYTLAGLANPVTGWGYVDESWTVLEKAVTLGGPTWFRLGDLDLGTHLERTRRLRLGESLSKITSDFCESWGIQTRIMPVTDDSVPTIVHTNEGDLAFQEYFVLKNCTPKVTGFTFLNANQSATAPGVLTALDEAQIILICPSNPFVSIDPILSIPGIMHAIDKRRNLGAAVVAVSPIIGGETVKGPAAKMFTELGITPSATAVAEHYRGIINGFVLDQVDASQAGTIQSFGIRTYVTNTLMPDLVERTRLAVETLDFCRESMTTD
jgi:LPPG:FO 2-phospho-L-lactate transferase